MLNLEDKVIKKTILWGEHEKLGARFTDFAEVNMPINYGSQIQEHNAVRNDAGVFDVSHMAVIDVTGKDALEFLNYILTNNLNKAFVNKAIYSCMCNEQGGIIDDLIIYNLSDLNSNLLNSILYRLVVNAGTWQKDLDWLYRQAEKRFEVTITKYSNLAILALQGPQSTKYLLDVLPFVFSGALLQEATAQIKTLKNFECFYDRSSEICIAKTGYTGENGYEIILPNEMVIGVWQKLLANGVHPCGLGARDTLRLEAGLNLYGSDMDETTTPLDCGLMWTVDLNKKFIGRDSIAEAYLNQQSASYKNRMVGLILDGKGVLRHGMQLKIADIGHGVITSGTYSPTLERSIAMARVQIKNKLIHDEHLVCEVLIRDKLIPAHVVSYPFVRFNKPVYKFLNKL